MLLPLESRVVQRDGKVSLCALDERRPFRGPLPLAQQCRGGEPGGPAPTITTGNHAQRAAYRWTMR